MSGYYRVALPMSGSGREAISDIREWLGGLPVCSGALRSPHECLLVVGRPSRMFGSGLEAFPNVRVWSRGPPGYLGVVGRPS